MNIYCVKAHWGKKDHNHFVMANSPESAQLTIENELRGFTESFKILSVTLVEDFFTIKI